MKVERQTWNTYCMSALWRDDVGSLYMFPDYMKIFNMHKQSVQAVELHKGKNMSMRMFMTDIAQGPILQCMKDLLENYLSHGL
jgi:hypothetical protein